MSQILWRLQIPMLMGLVLVLLAVILLSVIESIFQLLYQWILCHQLFCNFGKYLILKMMAFKPALFFLVLLSELGCLGR